MISYMTSLNSLFGIRLKELHKKGKLKSMLSASFKYSNIINEDTFLGSGDDATAFMCPNKKNVLKICCKTIGFFSYFPKANGKDFAKLSQKLNPYLLPVLDVLYEDDYVMVYTQPVCQKFDKSLLTRTMVIDILNIEIGFLKLNVWTSASRHNLGVYDGRAVVFDYHDLRPLEVNKKSLEKSAWWSRSFRHLIKFVAFYKDKDQAHRYVDAWDASNVKGVLELDKKLKILPLCFVNTLIEIDTERQKGIKLETLVKLLTDCRRRLQKELE
jgi:hypothetical protein